MKALWLWLWLSFVACRGPSPDYAEEEAEAGARSELPAPSSSGGQAEAPEGDCGAQPVTLAELHSGQVRADVTVALPPLVASSQKFLVSEAKSGSCLWGAFAASERERGAGSGVFLVSFGAPHAEGEPCLPGADGLPDSLAPGDSLDARGVLDEFVPASCDGVVPASQLRVDSACPVRLVGRTQAPAPAVVGAALADRLAAGQDTELLRAWNGALLQLSDVSAVRDAEDGDAVQPFGAIRLLQTTLEVHSRLYYFDLREGGPRVADKAPRFRYPTAFRSVTGVLFLDYCRWVLAPRDRCADLVPASEGCGG